MESVSDVNTLKVFFAGIGSQSKISVMKTAHMVSKGKELSRFAREAGNHGETMKHLKNHGPVILVGEGWRKLMRETCTGMNKDRHSSAIGIYANMRNQGLSVLAGKKYEFRFCEIMRNLVHEAFNGFNCNLDAWDMHNALIGISNIYGKRFVIFFDAEPRWEFFDIFRVISSVAVSCKVGFDTHDELTGKRFDLNHDATLIRI